MADDAPKKQDGGAIFDALTDFEGMPEREQQEQQERDWLGFDAEAEGKVDIGEGGAERNFNR